MATMSPDSAGDFPERSARNPSPEQVVEFVRSAVRSAESEGVVINMSGGIDSSTTVALATEAVGRNAVYGLCQPTLGSPTTAVTDANTMATTCDIPFDAIDIQPVVDLFEDGVAPVIATTSDRAAIGNFVARVRMAAAYYIANARNRLVIGTTNRTERTLGYVTKHGDDAVDCAPLADWEKTTVRRHAQDWDVPIEIVQKPPTAGIWSGQTDRSQLGAPYELLDPICRSLSDTSRTVEQVARTVGCQPSTVRQCKRRYRQTAHKRALPHRLDRTRLVTGMGTGEIDTGLVKTETPAVWDRCADRLKESVATVLDTADCDGVVVPLDGRLRSSLLASIAAEAVGSDRVTGLVLPCGSASSVRPHDAIRTAETLDIEWLTIDIAPLCGRIEDALPRRWTRAASDRTRKRLTERVRMSCLYYAANTGARLVLSPLSRTDWLLGTFTKHGENAADVLPFVGLFDSELRTLARSRAGELSVDDRGDRSIARTVDEQTRDEIVWQLADANTGIDRTATLCGVDTAPVMACAQAHCNSQHKRYRPPTPTASRRPDRTYFHELELVINQ